MTDQNNSATRRSLLIGAAAGGLAATSAHAAPQALSMADLKKEGDVACLYHCDYGDNARFAQTLNNISNHTRLMVPTRSACSLSSSRTAPR
jgi:hypothetical protein